MEKTEGNLHWQIVQNLMEGFDEDRALTEIADDICSLLSQHIKAKALTDEQIKQIEGEIFCQSQPNGDGFEFKVQKAVAAAQLQAVLGELE